MVRLFSTLSPVSRLCAVCLLLFFLFLATSALASGIQYQYDNDELSHAQYSYLISSGLVPHRDFFLRYTPVFSWFLLPFFQLFGFQFSTIALLRWVMVVLFLLRAVGAFRLVAITFGRNCALLFGYLFFLDPFTVFAGMQIRPDTLMMLVYTAGLLLVTRAFSRRSAGGAAVAGAVLSTAVLLLLKIIPSVLIICVGILLFGLVHRWYRLLSAFFLGMSLPVIIFALVMLSQGSFAPMIQQVISDSATMNRYLLNPTWASYFYTPGNSNLFGPGVYTFPWFFAWVLLVGSIIGAGLTGVAVLQQRQLLRDWQSFFRFLLAASFFLQLISISVFPGAFIQYFVSVSWLMALFTGILILSIVHRLSSYQFSFMLPVTGSVLLCLFASASIRANIFRAAIDSRPIERADERLWAIIPHQEATFPNLLFRPLAYPIPYGTFIGDLPPDILVRFGSIPAALEKRHVRFIFLDSYSQIYFDRATKEYIQVHYRPTKEPSLYQKED